MDQQLFTAYSKPLSHGIIVEKGEKKYVVEGFISTTDRDLVNDIVTEKALDSMIEQMKSRVIKLDFEHEAFRGESSNEIELNKTKMPLAKAVDFYRVKNKEQNGLKTRWEFNPNWKKFDSKGDISMEFSEVWDSVSKGFYDAFSIAFIPTSATKVKSQDGTQIRMLDGLKLLNVALTGNPVNPGASMTNAFLKSLDSIQDLEENNNQKEVKMTEDNTIKTDAKADKEDEKEEDEEEKKKESEKKSTDFQLEVKSMLKSMSDRISAIEVAISKPIQKAISEQTPVENKSEAKVRNPLDLI